ncbi:hypothetical protein BDV29DRAFT_180689 [Aspergillus leporis]|uniref:Uncharacterized protein n=1 Tax=Aspergillus leporis TaxID=41062 RepID=A0A5N5WU32_9EURO|nr:hypothetical protein BDV29DRAFT_180689 [Aspergillus leporis]
MNYEQLVIGFIESVREVAQGGDSTAAMVRVEEALRHIHKTQTTASSRSERILRISDSGYQPSRSKYVQLFDEGLARKSETLVFAIQLDRRMPEA